MSSLLFNNKGKVFGTIVLILVVAIIASVATYYILQNQNITSENPPIVISISGNKQNEYEQQKDIGPNEDTPISPSNLAFYDGFWVDIIMGGNKNSGEDLWIYKNSDNKINIDYIDTKNDIYFEIDDIEVVNNKGIFRSSGGIYEGTIETKEKIVEVVFTDTNTNTSYDYLFQKESAVTLTRAELFDQINYIIKGNYSEIDRRIFDYKDGKQFMSLSLANKCYIENRELKSSYGGVDYFRDVYTIDKTKNKLVTISEIIEDEEHARRVDSYISSVLGDKMARADSSGDVWPYPSFMGVLSSYNDVSKYFTIDEDDHFLTIKIFDTVKVDDEIYDDLWISVPFEYVFSDDRLISMGLEPFKALEKGSGDVSGDKSGEISDEITI